MLKAFALLMLLHLVALVCLLIVGTQVVGRLDPNEEQDSAQALRTKQVLGKIRDLFSFPIYQTILLLVFKWLILLTRV